MSPRIVLAAAALAAAACSAPAEHTDAPRRGTATASATAAPPPSTAVAPAAPAVDPRCTGAAPRGAIEIAVTVDDLPRHGKLPKGATRVGIVGEMTTAFERHGIRGVYGFVNGVRAETDDERRALSAWVAAGHRVGNHGHSHTSAEKLSAAEFLDELDRNEPILDPLRAPAGSTARVFRYPYLHQGKDLEARDANRKTLADRGYRVAEVTVDFADWAYTDPFTRCSDAKRPEVIRALRDSYLEQAEAALGWSDAAACSLLGRPIRHILLLHVGAFTASQTDALLTRLEEQGARFITLEEAMRDPVYDAEPSPAKSTRGQLLYQIRASRGARHVPIPAIADPVLGTSCN